MSELDLTEALDAAARAQYERQYPNTALPWDVMPAMNRHVAREMFLPLITAAAPIIEAQVREQVAAEIETVFEDVGGTYDDGFERARYLAASIARGQR